MAYSDLTEAVEALKKGDNEAFQYVYDNSLRYIYYTVLKSVQDKNLAEDIVQETYIEIYKNIGSLKEAGAFKGWAAVIAQNKISRYFRKKSDSLFSSEDEMDTVMDNMEEDDTAMLPEDAADNKETQRLVMEIIDALPEGQREAVVSFYYNQMSISEIASSLEVPENTVKTWLSRGKKKIKEEVIILSEKHGTKLFAVPFMLILSGFFTKDAEACELPADGFAKLSEKLSLENGADAAAKGAESASKEAVKNGTGVKGAVVSAEKSAAAGTVSSVNIGLIAAIGVVMCAAGAAYGVNMANHQPDNEVAVVSTAEDIETTNASEYEDVSTESASTVEEAESSEALEASTEDTETTEASTEEASTEEAPEDDTYEIPEVIARLQKKTETFWDGTQTEVLYMDNTDLYLIASESPVVDKGDYYEVSDTSFVFMIPDEDDWTDNGYEPVTVRVRKNAVMDTESYGTVTAEEYFSKTGTLGTINSGYDNCTLRTSRECLSFDSEGYIVKLGAFTFD